MRYKLSNTIEFDQYRYIIGNRYFIFRAVMFNDKSVVSLTKDAIVDLHLEDNLLSLSLTGHIIIRNDEDSIERLSTSNEDINTDNIKQIGFTFRGDSRDIINLTIIPMLDGSDATSIGSEAYAKEYGMNCYFILSDEENLSDENGKLKRYKLVDVDEQILKETKAFFTTSMLSPGVDKTQLTNEQRAAYTGECIAYILKNALNSDKAVYEETVNGVKTTPDFERGSTKLFFTSPDSFSYMDTINYLLEYHVSSSPSQDQVFLSKNVYTGVYTLISYSDLFSKAYINKQGVDAGGKYFLENFTIAGAQDTDGIKMNNPKKPLITLELGETSDIQDVSFFNIPSDDYSKKINSKIVHTYNISEKEFFINMIDGDIEHVSDEFNTFYVSTMKGKDNAPAPSLPLNQTKLQNKSYTSEFSVYNDYDSIFAKGRNKLLNNMLMLNIGVEISVKGNISRCTGKFFSIDRKGDYIDNSFDNKFLGIYFIISVDHSFKDGEYTNKIIAVKTYHFTDEKLSNTII